MIHIPVTNDIINPYCCVCQNPINQTTVAILEYDFTYLKGYVCDKCEKGMH